jgi:hypothetical protein
LTVTLAGVTGTRIDKKEGKAKEFERAKGKGNISVTKKEEYYRDEPRLTGRRDAIISIAGLLRFFSLDTLVDFFTVNRHFFRSIDPNTYLVALNA